MSFGNDAKLSDKEQATADAIGSLLRRSIPSSSSSPTSNLHEGCIEPLSYSKEAWVGNNSLHCYQEYGSSSASKGDVRLKKKHSNYHDLVSLVASQLDMVQKYLGEVESGVDTMHQHYQRVVTSGKEVSNECQQLLNCQQELLLSAERFDSMIKYFDQAEVDLPIRWTLFYFRQLSVLLKLGGGKSAARNFNLSTAGEQLLCGLTRCIAGGAREKPILSGYSAEPAILPNPGKSGTQFCFFIVGHRPGHQQ